MSVEAYALRLRIPHVMRLRANVLASLLRQLYLGQIRHPRVTSMTPKHCADYIDDEDAPLVLRRYLKYARSEAHGILLAEQPPKLFADHSSATRTRTPYRISEMPREVP